MLMVAGGAWPRPEPIRMNSPGTFLSSIARLSAAA
jgi:hypothetical protein